MITPLIVVIISQYIQILNHDVVHLKLLQSYMSIVSQLKGFPGSSVSKEPACKAGDCLQYKRPSSIPGSGSSPGEENGNPLQYSCLENSMDRGGPRGRKESDMTEQLIHTHEVLFNKPVKHSHQLNL